MNLYFVDIESYYDKQCNIKKLGVSQYINHPDFEFLTVGYKTPRMKRARVLHGAQIDKFFADLDPAETTFVAHNMYFDGYAIARHYDFVPHFMMCTYAMAQPVHSQYRSTSLDVLAEHYGLGRKIENALGKMEGKRRPDLTAEEYRILVEYNERDVELGEGIFNRMIKSFPREELDIIDLTLRMFIEPMLEVDGKRAQAIIEEERQAKVDACAAAGITEAEARSDLVLRGILEERGYECPMKWSAKQAKEIPALAQSDLPFQAMRDSDDAALAALAKARTACKSTINETRAQAILDRAGRPFPVYLLYCAAHTMRWGGGDKVNPQNMPRDGRLRSCLVAPPGYKLVIVDAAQIEARMLAWFAGQEDLVAAFARGDDVYSLFASVLYNRPVNKADNPDLRFVGKTSILGLGYQCGAAKFQLIMETGMMGPPVEFTIEEAQSTVNTYRTTYPMIKQTWHELQKMIVNLMPSSKPVEFRGLVFKPGEVVMPNGLSLHYPNIDFHVGQYDSAEFGYHPYDRRFKKNIPKKLYGGVITENIIQSLARTATTHHMMEINKYYPVVMMAHDEVVMCVPDRIADECLRYAIDVMAVPPDWAKGCPLEGEGGIHNHYVK